MPYLKGNIQDRITDLREQNGWSKAELAKRIGIDASRLGRLESGETRNVGDDVILALAKAFGVSTDFLLGVSDDPEPNNYDIKDLGLTVEAAKNLYTEKIDPDVLNLMMEDPRFGTLTYMIGRSPQPIGMGRQDDVLPVRREGRRSCQERACTHRSQRKKNKQQQRQSAADVLSLLLFRNIHAAGHSDDALRRDPAGLKDSFFYVLGLSEAHVHQFLRRLMQCRPKSVA